MKIKKILAKTTTFTNKNYKFQNKNTQDAIAESATSSQHCKQTSNTN